MRVFHSTTATVQDGRLEEATAIAGEASKLIGRHGGDCRFFLAAPAAGEAVNVTVFAVEYDSPEVMGTAFDELGTDVELQTLLTRLNGPGSPSRITAQMMGFELPIGRTPKPGRGTLLAVHTVRVRPGRMADAIAEAARVCEFVEANGAVNARAIQITYGGMMSGVCALSWELDNMRADARLAQAWLSPAGAALSTLDRVDSPVTLLGSALYTEVPL